MPTAKPFSCRFAGVAVLPTKAVASANAGEAATTNMISTAAVRRRGVRLEFVAERSGSVVRGNRIPNDTISSVPRTAMNWPPIDHRRFGPGIRLGPAADLCL